MYSKIFLFSALLSLMLSSVNVFADFLLITNSATEIDKISSKDMRNVYLKKKLYLYDGQSAVVAGMEEDEARDLFLSDVLRKSESTLNSYWSRLMFTGRANPPRLFQSSEKLLTFVAKTPGAVAYVGSDVELIEGVKVLDLTVK